MKGLKRFFLLCAVAAVGLLLAACAPAPTENAVDPPQTGLSAMLEMPSHLPDGQSVVLKFTLTNNSAVELYVLKWYTPLEGIAGEIFRVERDGQAIPYQGILAMRGDPTPDDYLWLEAGRSVSAEVDLATAYDFSEPGEYTIAFISPRISHVARAEDQMAASVDDLGPVEILSNRVTVRIGSSSSSPAANTPISTLPTATTTAAPVPTPTPSGWPAADPDSLPDADLVLYSQGARLKSSPHRPVYDRPEINQIHNRDSQHFEMFMYVLSSGPIASPDGRYVVFKAPAREPPPPAPPTWLIDVESGRMRKLEVKGREAAGVGPVTWSPDGCCLTFVVEDTLYVYDVQADAGPVDIFTQPGLRRFYAGWSPTGEWIAVVSDANPQDSVSAERENIYWLISPDGAVIRNLGQHPVAGYGEVSYNLDWSPDGSTFVTPSQCLISSYDGSANCGDSTAVILDDPTQWLPRAWVRSYLGRQFAGGERPSFYTRRLSPGAGQIAYSLYDDTAQHSDLYIFDRSTNSHRQVGSVSGYIINEIRWAGGEDFLVVGLGDPKGSIEGGPVILLFDAGEGGPPQVLIEGEDLYLIDVIPNYPAAGATTGAAPALAPTAVLPWPVAAPVPSKTGPVVNIPGSDYGVVELSHLDPPACCPTLAPDGERLAFATCRTMAQKVYVQNVDGSSLKEISSLRIYNGDGPCPDPAWSPDGQQLVFVNYDSGLYVVNADGTNLTRLEPEGRAPAWSPDGGQIAFSAGLAIAVMNHDGSGFRLLTNDEAHDQRPAWSPDGQQIAFVSQRDGNGEIYAMNSDGGDQRRLTNNEAQDWGPVWSPDGRFIVFTSDRDGDNGIYAMKGDGADQRWLMDTDAPLWWPMDTTRVRFVEVAK